MNRGFTFVENAIIVALVGILAAIALPSFGSYLQRQRMSYAVSQIEGSLRVAQREAAMRQGRSCTVTIPEGNPTQITSTCQQGERLEVPIDVVDPAGTLTITYNFRGYASTNFSNGMILVGTERCVNVGLIVGLVRSGQWKNGTCEILDV